MKIGKIENIRCDEPTDETFVVVPDGLTQEEFEGAVRRAKREYEAVMADTVLDYSTPQQPTLGSLRKLPPEMPVADVLAAYDRKKEDADKAKEKVERRRRSFGYYLEREGLPVVQRSLCAFSAKVDWGHRHGQKIRYDGIESPFHSEWWDETEGNELCTKKED